MFKILFLLFLIIPLVEIAILIEIGKIFGAGYTILLVIVTAAIGAALFRAEGLSTLSRIQVQVNQGSLPATELLEGFMLLIAGALLLTPGFFTDVFGFLVLILPLRRHFAESMLSRIIASRMTIHETTEGTIIEGEWEAETKEQIRKDD